MKYPLLALIKLYQWTISPLLGPVCKYYPSCSHYGYQAIDRQYADANNLSVHEGALIQPAGRNSTSPAVVAGSPADQAGIREGDIITKVNDQAIDTDHPLDATLSMYAPGDTVTISLLRDGQTVTVQLKLGTRPAN